MSNASPLLLKTPPPYKDEGLAGYILRLAQRNYYQSPNWILKLAGVTAHRRLHLSYKPSEPSRLSQLTQVEDEQLRLLALFPYQAVSDSSPLSYTIYKYARKLCPSCLEEFPYCRKLWDWKMVKVCHEHQCLLIKTCPGCQEEIKWSRPGVARCRCGFDFRNALVEPASFHQVHLSRYLYSLISS